MKHFDKSKLVNKTNMELEVYINEPEKFESEAVECAVHILEDRGYRLSEIELESIARKQNANQKIKLELGKEYFWASNLLFLLLLVNVCLLFHLVNYDFRIFVHLVFSIPNIVIFICAILLRISKRIKYFIPLLFFPIAFSHIINTFTEKPGAFENTLMYSQYIIWCITNIILFTKKSPTS
jgi:hypothetical protein